MAKAKRKKSDPVTEKKARVDNKTMTWSLVLYCRRLGLSLIDRKVKIASYFIIVKPWRKAPIINVILILILFITVLLGYLQNLTVEFPTTEAEDHSEEISRIEEYFHRNPLQNENEKYFLDVSTFNPQSWLKLIIKVRESKRTYWKRLPSLDGTNGWWTARQLKLYSSFTR